MAANEPYLAARFGFRWLSRFVIDEDWLCARESWYRELGMARVLLLELNELNLNFVQAYIRQGKLKNFKALIDAHGIQETTSEANYSDWEPWIQWITAHTGLSLSQHGIYRLGDIVGSDVEQIWEELEKAGVRVGAFCPMNASNRLENPAFFLPDPWTKTTSAGPRLARLAMSGIASGVEGNAGGMLSGSALLKILVGLCWSARPENYGRYVALAVGSLKSPWRRAVFLDLLLSDMFLKLMRTTRPEFASAFLNAGAHLQHHYMFSSASYLGTQRNPTWYISAGDDPILEIYEVYDRLLGRVAKAMPATRLLIATGLHQEPHARLTYYWRLADHAAFLAKCGVTCERVEPRMSRDFVVYCRSAEEAARAQFVLESAEAGDDEPLFRVDNRGSSLFVELSYEMDVPRNLTWRVGNHQFEDLKSDVVFVAVKNGEHDGVGYVIDTGCDADCSNTMPLTALAERVRSVFRAAAS